MSLEDLKPEVFEWIDVKFKKLQGEQLVGEDKRLSDLKSVVAK